MREIDLLAAQIDDARGRDHAETDFGQRRLDLRQTRNEPQGGERVRQRQGHAARRFRQGLRRGADAIERRLDLIEIGLARSGEAHLVPGALEELLTEIGLELSHLMADRRIRQAERLGGLAELPEAGSGVEAPQGVERRERHETRLGHIHPSHEPGSSWHAYWAFGTGG